MTTERFPKEDLLELLDHDKGEGFDSYTKISDKIVDNGRWTIQHQLIFKFGDKFYQAYYQVGATEYQDERPWENDGNWIACDEMVRVEKTVFVYEVKKDEA